jgi:S-formylglutathione hydrolase FrmB
MRNGSYSDWYNYGHYGTPRWETFHTKEVIQLMERNYRAGSSRAAMGISSGAEGAITYAARHPGMFKFAASYSGILHLTQPGIPAILMGEDVLYSGGGYDPFRIWGIPGTKQGDAVWRAHDPYYLAQNLRGTSLYISAGTTGNPGPYDPKNLPPAEELRDRMIAGTSEQLVGSTTVSFLKRLRQLKISATTDIYGDGWHQWAYWINEYHKAWPLIMKAIGAKQV